LGKLPEYFEFHHSTCVNLEIDFIFFVDHEVDPKFYAPNFKFIRTDRAEIEHRLSQRTGEKMFIDDSYKMCDVRPAYGDIFSDYLQLYEFFGYYDIDTLFGDIVTWMEPYFTDFDVISFGEDSHVYNRVSGPLTIMRNNERTRTIYKTDPRFYECMKTTSYGEYDEHKIMRTYRSLGIPVKILFGASNMISKSKRIEFDAVWTGGKVYVNGDEKMLHHFIRKELTNLTRKGNSIVSRQQVQYEDDFYFITYFTKNYEPILRTLINSLARFSKHRCVLYTVNYTSDLMNELSDQFIVRRIDITGDDFLDGRGRSFNTITSKPVIQLDSLRAFPGRKFVFLDTDIYCTVNIDGLAKYFKDLENYPLTNSHVHDVVYCIETGTHISSLHVLGEETGVEIRVWPRRKTNVMLYDERSAWFFEEQMQVYHDHKDCKTPGIFKYHDEDTFNLLLSKYGFYKSLPVVDLEEVYSIDINRMFNYSYSETPISELARVPKSDRDVYVFHGYKDANSFQRIDDAYSVTVIDGVDVLVKYDGKDLIITKNSFLEDKNILPMVNVIVLDEAAVIFTCPWNVFSSQFFYVWDILLTKGKSYTVELEESSTKRLIYRSFVKP
jgi:hypothetical protein